MNNVLELIESRHAHLSSGIHNSFTATLGTKLITMYKISDI